MFERINDIAEFIRKMEWREWRRVFLLFLFLIIIVIATGSSMPLNEEEASVFLELMESGLPEPGIQTIFTHNFAIAALMFTPAYGLLVGVITSYNTGLAIAAIGLSINFSGILLLLTMFLLPFTWLEFISYSIAMTQSVYLIIALVRRNIIKELMRTGILLAMVFLMLLIGAFIEFILISI